MTTYGITDVNGVVLAKVESEIDILIVYSKLKSICLDSFGVDITGVRLKDVTLSNSPRSIYVKLRPDAINKYRNEKLNKILSE